jgi:hypothetical protein
MHRQILSCLADLLRNRSAVPYFKAWRSDRKMYGAAVMCLTMWAAEERRLGIVNGPGGILENLDKPLRGLPPTATGQTENRRSSTQSQSESPTQPAVRSEDEAGAAGETDSDREEEQEPKAPSKLAKLLSVPDSQGSAGKGGIARLRAALKAARDLVIFGDDAEPGAVLRRAVEKQDMRINLWSVLDVVTWDKLGTETDDCADGTALAVLALARNYEEFLVCETWQDVKEKLDADGLAPIRPDALQLQLALESAFNTAMNTRHEQTDHLADVRRKAQMEEEQFYDNIRHKQEQEIQAHLVTRKMVNPNKKYSKRMQLKKEKDAMLAASAGVSGPLAM